MTNLRTLALGLSLLMSGALPAFASSESPVEGVSRPVASPVYVADGDAAPSFLGQGGQVRTGVATLGTAAEATVSPRA